jgi:hypothetical protein
MHLKTEVSAGFMILSNNLLTNSEKKKKLQVITNMRQITNLAVKLEICHRMNILHSIFIRNGDIFTTRSQFMHNSFPAQLFSQSKIQTKVFDVPFIVLFGGKPSRVDVKKCIYQILSELYLK